MRQEVGALLGAGIALLFIALLLPMGPTLSSAKALFGSIRFRILPRHVPGPARSPSARR